MLSCDACSSVFRACDMDSYTEAHGEEMDRCPICGDSLGFTEVSPCRDCGGYFAEDDLHEGLCAACGNKLMRRLRSLLGEHFSPTEILFLNYAYENEGF